MQITNRISRKKAQKAQKMLFKLQMNADVRGSRSMNNFHPPPKASYLPPVLICENLRLSAVNLCLTFAPWRLCVRFYSRLFVSIRGYETVFS